MKNLVVIFLATASIISNLNFIQSFQKSSHKLNYCDFKNSSASASIYETLLMFKKSIVFSFHSHIYKHEFKVYSQNNEDGVIMELIKMFNLEKRRVFLSKLERKTVKNAIRDI